MTEIKFQDPPPDPRPKAEWQRIADTLKERPGEWAYIGRRAAITPRHIKRGYYKALPAGEFDAVARNTDSRNRADIYARYVGGAA